MRAFFFLLAGLSPKTKREQEEAVSEAVDHAVGGVLELIRNRQLDLISIDHTAEVVAGDIAQIYAMVEVRYENDVRGIYILPIIVCAHDTRETEIIYIVSQKMSSGHWQHNNIAWRDVIDR